VLLFELAAAALPLRAVALCPPRPRRPPVEHQIRHPARSVTRPQRSRRSFVAPAATLIAGRIERHGNFLHATARARAITPGSSPGTAAAAFAMRPAVRASTAPRMPAILLRWVSCREARQLFGSFGAGKRAGGVPGLRNTRIMRSAISRPR